MTYPNIWAIADQVDADDLNDSLYNPAYTYGDTIAALKAVYLDSATGKLKKASATDEDQVEAFVGFTITAGVLNDTNRILGPGKIVTGLSGLTAGEPVYLSDTAGEVSTTPGTFSLVVGIAVSTTAILILPEATSTGGFGDGSDGDVTLTGNVTLTRDMFYNNLTIDGAYNINAGGYKIYVKGVLKRNTGSTGKIYNNGGAGGNGGNAAYNTAGTAGTAGSAAPGGTLPAGKAGLAGVAGLNLAKGAGTGSSGVAGNAGNNGVAATNAYSNQNSAAGKAGGTARATGASSYAGGAAGATGSTTQTKEPANSQHSAENPFCLLSGTLTEKQICASAPSSGSGAVSSYNASYIIYTSTGGSGGSGASGGMVVVFAHKIIDLGTGTMFEAIGGDGGDAGTGHITASGGNAVSAGSSASAGGNGGIVVIGHRGKFGTCTVDVSGGTGGTGAPAITYGTYMTAEAGQDGADGNAGLSIELGL